MLSLRTRANRAFYFLQRPLVNHNGATRLSTLRFASSDHDRAAADFIRQLDNNSLRKSDVRVFIHQQRDLLNKYTGRSRFRSVIAFGASTIGWLAIGGAMFFFFTYMFSSKSGGGSRGLFSGMIEDTFEVVSPDDDQISDDEDDDDTPVRANKSLPTFADVCGNQEAKEELKDIVNFLRNPQAYKDMGIKVPKGILLCGPPGVGKTLMARALAGEANVTFLHATGSSFDQVFVGVGSARVRSLFETARQKAPSIIFIDEFDAVAENRQSWNANRMTLNQLLSAMDGFTTNDEVIVVAATNLPKRLDPAVVRSGRFDRHVHIALPDREARAELLKLNLKGKRGDPSIDFTSLAAETVGCSGADIANVVNLAAIEAVKAHAPKITTAYLRDAFATVVMGRARKSLRLTPELVRETAYHEAGHATVSLFTPGANSSSQMTVLPRGNSLGTTWSKPDENQEYSSSKEQMLAKIDVCMGGMAAEELVYGKEKVSSGASNDFRQATSIATQMVASCGMSDAFGKVSVDTDDMSKSLSPEMRRVLDSEVRSILDASYTRVCALLREKEHVVRSLADNVIKKETLQEHDILEIAGLLNSKNSSSPKAVASSATNEAIPPSPTNPVSPLVPVLSAPGVSPVKLGTELVN